MTTGEGIFWAAVAYFLVNALTAGYDFYLRHSPKKTNERLARMERFMREMGLEEWQ